MREEEYGRGEGGVGEEECRVWGRRRSGGEEVEWGRKSVEVLKDEM